MNREEMTRAVRELRGQVTAGSGDWLPFVDASKVAALLECCEGLLPLLDAVELGEVEQYRRGVEDGKLIGMDLTLEAVAQGLLEGSYDDWSDTDFAGYLRSMKSTASEVGKGV